MSNLHIYLDGLAALPQGHLTDLPRVSTGRRDRSIFPHTVHLHKERDHLREISLLCLAGYVSSTLSYFIPAIFFCAHQQAPLGRSL